MFCSKCGHQFGMDVPPFCTHCGAPAAAAPFDAAQPGVPERVMAFRFFGEGGALFGIAFKVFLLTIVTLGIYSFWGVVRKRKYMYSQTDLDGQRFHFSGTGLELFVGWLKAIGVLIALGLQAGLMHLVFGNELGSIIGNVTWQVSVFLLIPLVIAGAWRYRLSRSSYRGIRFSFRGPIGECYRVYVLGVLFTALTLGIYTPFFLTNLRRYLVSHSYWGTLRFQFDGEGRDLIVPWIVCLLLAVPTLGLSILWFEGRKQIYFWNRSRFAGARFETSMTPMGYLGIQVITMILTAVTLGIASPWATVMKAQYVCDHLRIRGVFDLTAILQQAQAAGALGEEMAGILDVEAAGFEL